MGIIRKTKSLQALLEAFDQSDNALSVVELIKRFQKDMNKTTVYRILERLEEDGILHSFVGKDGLKWVAKQQNSNSTITNCHPHFQCQECGKTECVSADISLPSIPNHRVDSANLILIGQCEDCLS